MKSKLMQIVAANYAAFKNGLYTLSKKDLMEASYKIQFYEFMSDSLPEISKILSSSKVQKLIALGDCVLDKLWEFYCSDLEYTFYSWDDRIALVQDFLNVG